MIKQIPRSEVLDAIIEGKQVFVFTVQDNTDGLLLGVNLTDRLCSLSENDEYVIVDYGVQEPKEPPENLDQRFDDMVDEMAKVQAAQAQTDPPKSQKKIDKGKIKALYEAGWSQTKIADEMGLAPNTISYHISKLRDAGEIEAKT